MKISENLLLLKGYTLYACPTGLIMYCIGIYCKQGNIPPPPILFLPLLLTMSVGKLNTGRILKSHIISLLISCVWAISILVETV